MTSLAGFASSPAKDKPPEGLSGSDWSSIREAYESGRHQLLLLDGMGLSGGGGTPNLTTDECNHPTQSY